MIRVIKREQNTRIECPHCNSLLSYAESDLTIRSERKELLDRYMDCKLRTATKYRTTIKGFVCPVCKSFITVRCIELNTPVAHRNLTKEEVRAKILLGEY